TLHLSLHILYPKAPTYIDKHTLYLHDALPIYLNGKPPSLIYDNIEQKRRNLADNRSVCRAFYSHGLTAEKSENHNRIQNDIDDQDRKSTRLNSSHVSISYAVLCLKKKTKRGTK